MNQPDCNEIQSLVRSFSLIKDCSQLPNGMLRFAVPFKYSDGSNIDLFFGQNGRLNWHLTDLGMTTGYLLDQHVKFWSTKKRTQYVSDVLCSLEIQREGGELFIEFDKVPPEAKDFTDAIVRLSQACIRIADLAIQQRFRTPATFADSVEEFVASNDLSYEPGVSLYGRHGTVKIDFEVVGRTTKSLVQAVASVNPTALHNEATDKFAKWHDLANYKPEFGFVTLYNSDTNTMRADDIARLGDISTVFGFPAEHEAIQATLAA